MDGSAEQSLCVDKCLCSPLQRAKEIKDFLLFLSAQLVEVFDDLICLAASASVSFDGVNQVAGASVVKEEDALPEAPKGSCSELVGARAALCNAIREAFAHVVDQEIGEKIRRLI
jgi:hypothetical protein